MSKLSNLDFGAKAFHPASYIVDWMITESISLIEMEDRLGDQGDRLSDVLFENILPSQAFFIELSSVTGLSIEYWSKLYLLWMKHPDNFEKFTGVTND